MENIIRNDMTKNAAFIAVKNQLSTARDEKTGEVKVSHNYLKKGHFDSPVSYAVYMGECAKAAESLDPADVMQHLNVALDFVLDLMPNEVKANIHHFNERIAKGVNKATATATKDKETGYTHVKARAASFIAHNIVENYVYAVLNGAADTLIFIENDKDKERIAKMQEKAIEAVKKAEAAAEKAAAEAAAEKAAESKPESKPESKSKSKGKKAA